VSCNQNPTLDPDSDRVTRTLGALDFYQLAIPSPRPRPGIDFDLAAARRGDELFSGKAKCNSCHVEPLWTEPGWNLHPPRDLQPSAATPPEFLIDDFQANRAPLGAFLPDGTPLPDKGNYKTMNLAGLFVRENGVFMAPENAGRFYHDGRFRTLKDVVISYNVRFALGLGDGEMNDLVEYLKSLFSNGSAVD
jgi:cytochrome c peroxidase